MILWAFTVFSYLTLATTTYSFPTPEACEAARQAANEFSQDERPAPVVGFCEKVLTQEALVSH